jgi:hypothetical protein
MHARGITTIVTLVGVALMIANSSARAEGDLLAWCIAHQRMEAKWQRAEPKCGWTVGGYTCRRKDLIRGYASARGYAATK